MEVWKPIEGHEGYEVSSLGRVRSVDRVKLLRNRHGGVNERRFKGRVLVQGNGTNGYMSVQLGRDALRLVHRLVAKAFIDGDNSLQVNHKNGIRNDNRAENLEWMSCRDNHLHSYSSLKRKQHEFTRCVLVDGVMFASQNEAARHLGVQSGTVSSAVLHGHKVKGKTVQLIEGEKYESRRKSARKTVGI
jgi:hypothetical protein